MVVTNEKSVSEAIKYRRSVRVFKNEPIDAQKVTECIELATLAATSSNMQLWEFYHIVSPETIQKLTAASFDQNAAKTAQQMVIVVARKDLWRKRVQSNIDYLKSLYGDKPESSYSKREKFALNYYQKIIPTLYFDFLGIFGMIKFIAFQIIGLFKPIYREARQSDMRIVAHKSAGLAAQNFMISMAAINYDTCPMEGFDSLRIKKILHLPASSEINMIIGCGLREEQGVYGERFRIPFEDVYFKI
ncbi:MULTISPECIES: nitroreductase family protein [Flavobacterium]|uniref:Nitroreductase family protein n=1 Tax=Flavobacterium gawalongense TaxID=2594432 RepID=A0A553BS34_9FLAO|nr:nitroreductase family protein [Flavobacterium gawalongense]TRX03178.1 nitroreductase family protein [Flavobacterium gawalongense]TRX09840.1 nitroreductase family protein [Flavobacterium gawalongense]TRX11068.1 nitroreductase family protein [Flavobacterium gawalongense]TRX11969.1 nitroreductase family protein [Flavobacterium gawalongense]TRX29815.1 nitroreductase family protein [Flavobacterium gawalongense]